MIMFLAAYMIERLQEKELHEEAEAKAAEEEKRRQEVEIELERLRAELAT